MLKSLDLDKFLTYVDFIPFPPLVLDSRYIEYLIYRLFYIDVVQLIKIKATLAKEFHIQPSEIERMPYWEYEMWLQEIQNQVKESNERQEQEAKKYDTDKYAKGFKDPTKNFRMPNFGNMNLSMPKFK